MTSVFIVRPVGTKSAPIKKDRKDILVDVNFDEIESSLIQKALERNGIVGQTTGEIAHDLGPRYALRHETRPGAGRHRRI